MKVFQILNGFCYYDMTKDFPTLASTEGCFAPNIHIVEAPDKVFEGWGYDETAEGDERFLQPQPPEGWVYDETTGTFSPEGFEPEPTVEEDTAAMLVDHEFRLTLLELGLSEY